MPAPGRWRRGAGFRPISRGCAALPGIGPYTAAAVAAIAFGVPVVPVDGNVERVAARLFAIDATPCPAPNRRSPRRRRGWARTPSRAGAAGGFRPGAVRPRRHPLHPGGARLRPLPVGGPCAARRQGIAATCRGSAQTGPSAAVWRAFLADRRGRVLLRRRPPRGLLGGMSELPGTPWRAEAWSEADALAHAPMPASWRLAGEVRHGFTHFELRIAVFAGTVARIDAEGFLHPIVGLDAAALPSVMRKCVAAVG